LKREGVINFVLIGAKATGKTVYLASLFLNEKSVTFQDGKTIEYLKPLADDLLNGNYPQATAGMLHELLFNYKDDEFMCQLQIDDVDGYFIETMHKDDETTREQREQLIKNIKNSEGIIFFFPYEEEFNEESIKNFNYEIDTFITKLTQMYKNHTDIPVPAAIVVSKWDRSPYFKAPDENEKALEYIDSNELFKKAKEKIEHHFKNLMITPISAIGKDIEHMEPYNLIKPLKFFIEKTYALWEEKINKLKDNKEELLKYLSKINFDLKFYKNGKYYQMYNNLEKEFAQKLLKEFSQVDSYSKFQQLEEEYKNIISYLKQDSINKILEIGGKLKRKQNVKKFSIGTVVLIALGLAGLGGVGWYTKTKLLKDEKQLYTDISLKSQSGNYKEALKGIQEYESNYKDSADVNHKSNIEKVKAKILENYKSKLAEIEKSNSLIKQYNDLKLLYKEASNIDEIKEKYNNISKIYNDYNKVLESSKDISNLDNTLKILNKFSVYDYKEIKDLKENLKKEIEVKANNILDDPSLDNPDKIDDILSAFTALGVDNEELVSKLQNKKYVISVENKFKDFKDEVVATSNFREALLKVESDWRDEYSDENKASIIRNILDNKFNKVVAKKLKNTLVAIGDIDDYNNLRNRLIKIESLIDNTYISKINFKANLDNENKSEYKKKLSLLNKYSNILTNGISGVKITFGARIEDNDPLGFKCGKEDEIILKIDNVKYHYDNGYCHDVQEMTWNSNQTFKAGIKYNVHVIEKDLVSDDEFDFWFKLGTNQLIKLTNEEYVQIDHRDYFIGLGEK